MAGSREAPHVPRLRCGQAAESALSTRKSPAGQNSSKKRDAASGGSRRLSPGRYRVHQNEKNRAESRFTELCRRRRASCVAEVRASQRAKPASPEREFPSKFRQNKTNFEIFSKFFTHIPPLTKGLALGSSYGGKTVT